MENQIYLVVNNIISNKKRADKLASLPVRKRREQAKKYVVAECQALKIRLNGDDISRAAVKIAG